MVVIKLQPRPLLRIVTDDTLRAEAIPVEPSTDRHPGWRRGVAILAALLLHLAAVATLIGKLPPQTTPQPEPIPVELAYEPPKPPEPTQQEPPKPQQPSPDRESGGDLENVAPGALPAATPAPQPAAPVAEPQPPAAMPPLLEVPSPQSEPVPPAVQQAMSAPPVPRVKPPAPATQKVAVPAPEQPQATTPSPDADWRPGQGGGDKYLNAMRDQILRHLVYPPTAELFQITGVAIYEIAISRNGELLDARVSESSGYDLLDRAGLQTIRLSAPFGPVPEEFAGEGVVFTLTLPMGSER